MCVYLLDINKVKAVEGRKMGWQNFANGGRQIEYI